MAIVFNQFDMGQIENFDPSEFPISKIDFTPSHPKGGKRRKGSRKRINKKSSRKRKSIRRRKTIKRK